MIELDSDHGSTVMSQRVAKEKFAAYENELNDMMDEITKANKEKNELMNQTIEKNAATQKASNKKIEELETELSHVKSLLIA